MFKYYISTELKFNNKTYGIEADFIVDDWCAKSREILEWSIDMSDLSIWDDSNSDEILFNEDNTLFHDMLIKELSYNNKLMDELLERFWDEFDRDSFNRLADELYDMEKHDA